MASDTRNVKLGVCSVTFDGNDLGYTKGGVEVEVKTETKKVMVDQFGNSEINEYILGRTCSAKVPLAETTLENMARIMPGSSLVATGGVKATGTVTVASVPANGDKVTINGVAFTFKTTPVSSTDLAIPASVGAGATALRDAINASINPLISQMSASASAGVVTLTADDAGAAANSWTLVGTATVITVVAFSGGADATKKKVVVPNGIGISLLSLAKKLVLHPIALPAEDKSEDFIIPQAMTPGEMNFSYKLDDERIFSCTFTAYPDSATKTLFIVGDESAS